MVVIERRKRRRELISRELVLRVEERNPVMIEHLSDQLVLELYTRSISASVEFYQRFGFRLLTTQPSSPQRGSGS